MLKSHPKNDLQSVEPSADLDVAEQRRQFGGFAGDYIKKNCEMPILSNSIYFYSFLRNRVR